MIELGRIVVKTAGRDAGKKGVVIEIIDDTFVMVDGQLRRKRCNIMHLEPLSEKASIEKNASHDAVVAELKKAGINVAEKKTKQKSAKPTKARKPAEAKPAVEKKPAKKATEKKAPAKKKAEKAISQ